MEGLIPYLIHTIKKQRHHQQSHKYRCLSDGSRRSYHLLSSAGNSVNGSSHHRRTQSEFMPPASMELQTHVDNFVRSRSFKTRQVGAAHNYDYNNYNYSHDKHVSVGMKKVT